ncbi:13632_t:CDS:2 [Funneliformis mosseae]|uniref:13632_t:CDS:1 n=1 Tax=Funneliformis mosseae TaxID=27381 RepID=A0A9N9AK87_FUNMO|nr:13632_t:CDS:2 [Funneliformis mosseae]
MSLRDTRILVSIDFGTTFSGFAYVHKGDSIRNPDIVTNDIWPDSVGDYKTPTALLYDKAYKEVKNWGTSALEDESDYDYESDELRPRPVELFKLYISDLEEYQKPWLPPQFEYKKAIEDYLTQMQLCIKYTIEKRFPGINFPLQVGLILTIPAEWPHHTTAIMRRCAYKAGLIKTLDSTNLEFTTEPEAAALYCLGVVGEHGLRPGDTFLVADCGGGTIDITTQLLQDNKLVEITERVGDLCGSTFIDKEFLRWLGRKVGFQALEKLKLHNYGQMQHLVQKFFCPLIKFKFNGNPEDFRQVKLNLFKYCDELPQYIKGEHRQNLENIGWTLKLDFTSVKGMFDPVINRILELIESQLDDANERISAMFLVGGFGESPYLLRRVRETFGSRVPNISVPVNSKAAVVRGAIVYGLNIDVVRKRVLKWTYGIQVCRDWVAGEDDEDRRTPDGKIFEFRRMVKRRTQVEVNKPFPETCYPVKPNQTSALFKIYYTTKDDAIYCDESGVKLLGTLRILMPDIKDGLNRPIEFSLTFARLEVKATAINKRNGKIYDETSFELDI